MDWEALCDFQHSIIGKESVIVVSAAPIYGVKVIEAIQKVFTFFGKALHHSIWRCALFLCIRCTPAL